MLKAEEAIAYIHSRLKFGVRPGMERIEALCRELGDPQDELRCIHVAGTNGKGSTCTMLSGILRAAGYKTGLFISPYVVDFRERIQLSGDMISPEDLACTVSKVKAACDKLDGRGIEPTEFEALSAAAFLFFKESGCDAVVLETGLGGRLDSTNVIKRPLASVITSVSYDHMAVLGSTLAEIAAEKCGIIKAQGVTVAYPEQRGEVMEIIEKTARERENRLAVPDMSEFKLLRRSIRGTDVLWRSHEMHIPFAGDHMVKNAALAVTAALESKLRVSDEDIIRGIEAARMPARMELISESPAVILDGGHNEGCAEALGDFIKNFVPGRKIAVCALMGDKDCGAYLRTVAPLFDRIIFTRPENPRSADPEELVRECAELNPNCRAAVNPIDACREGINELNSGGGALVVCGSFYLAGEVRSFLIENF